MYKGLLENIYVDEIFLIINKGRKKNLSFSFINSHIESMNAEISYFYKYEGISLLMDAYESRFTLDHCSLILIFTKKLMHIAYC